MVFIQSFRQICLVICGQMTTRNPQVHLRNQFIILLSTCLFRK
ncbi:hypothetical protein HMPREF9103_01576 [Lentilactobacillus parafarraginis F0439]|uniref:Uncharacterized protein n=1 Tax=Lentilactobacillus parafarraginis F0439 TaxID=797515 RepID=G9ZPC2_9LACO|nr:hypothetical protein HMPREF9103_01576 [Lentilactobacillus parafarraginis F0439]